MKPEALGEAGGRRWKKRQSGRKGAEAESTGMAKMFYLLDFEDVCDWLAVIR